MPNPSPTRPADAARAARLDERLALYAQYASLVGDEVAAAWSADPAEAGVMTREIAESRADVAARYEALKAAGEPTAGEPAPFGALYADAVTEIAHQRAVDQALRDRLEAGRYGAAPALLPAPTPDAGADADATIDDAPVGIAPLGGALVTARSHGIGGALGGQFPGIVAGEPPAIYHPAPPEPPMPATRLDVRF